jgi:hypothetical protein
VVRRDHLGHGDLGRHLVHVAGQQAHDVVADAVLALQLQPRLGAGGEPSANSKVRWVGENVPTPPPDPVMSA